MANCCAVLLFLCRGLLVPVLFRFPDEVPNNLDFLPAVAAGLVRRMDDHLLHKLVDNRGRRFGNPCILPDDRRKTVKVRFVLLVGMYHFPVCLDLLRQFFLLRFILGRSLQKPFVGNCAGSIVLINALENPVKFRDPLFCLGNFPPAFFLPPFPLPQTAVHTPLSENA